MSLTVRHVRVLAIADDLTHPEQVQPTDWGSTASTDPTHVVEGTVDAGDLDLSGVVPITRTINGLPLSDDVVLLPADVGVDLDSLVLTGDARLSDARVALAHTHAFAELTSRPTTLAGYGIADAVVLTGDARLSDARVPVAHTQAFSTITATPTSLAGYGILDPVVLPTRTVNGHALSADVTVTKADVELGNVENTALSTGNAATATLAAAATVLQTPRTINGVSFDGSGNITVPAAAGSLTGATLAANVLASSLTSVGVLAALTATGILTTSVNGIAAVDTDGLVLQNATPATAAIPVQQGPRFRIRGNVWNTTATAANNTDDWWIEGVPTSGAPPSSTFKIGKSLNGGTVTYPLTISSAGLLIVRDGIFGANGNWGITSGGALTLPTTGTVTFGTRGVMTAPAAGLFGLNTNGAAQGVSLDLNTDAVFRLRNRANTFGAALDLSEQTAPTGVADTVRLYAEDNGSGKTRLMAIFPSGVAQQVAIEP